MVENNDVASLSAKKYRLLFKNSISCIAFHEIVYDANNNPIDYIITDVNPMFEKVMHFKKEDVVGEHSTKLYRTEEPPFFDIYLNVAETLKPTSFTAKFDILNRYYKISVFSIEKGTFITNFEDITDHMEAIEKLKEKENELKKINLDLEGEVKKRAEKVTESEIKFQNIIKSIPMGIHMYKLEPDGKLVFIGANPAADRILGVDNSLFIGKTIEEAFPPLIETEVPKQYRKVAKEGGLWSTEQVDYQDEQIKGAFEVHAFQTSPGKMAAFFLDISKRLKAELKLKESEVKYYAIFNQAADAITITDPENGEIIEFNSKSFENLGYTYDEFKSMKISDYNMSESEEDVKNHIKNIVEKGSDIFVAKFKTKTGQLKDMLINAKLITIQNKQYIQAISRDITELQESEEKYRILFEQAADTILIIDPYTAKIIDFNKSSYEILGYTQEEFEIKDLLDFSIEESKEDIEKNIKKILDTGSITHELKLQTKSGKIKDFLINSRKLNYQNKTVIQTIAKDITDLKKAEKKSQQAYRLAEFYKDLFAHDISNIMQNILTSIELSSIYLKDKEGPEKIFSLFELMKTQVKRGASLVSNVRKLSSLEEPHLEIESIDLNELIDKSIIKLKLNYPDVPLKIRIESEKDKYMINATSFLGDVFENILNNAVKHNDNIEIEILIKILDIKKDDLKYVKLEFIDNGRGVIDSQKSEVFERQASENQDLLGIGLGLSLVKRIVKIVRGKVWVEDRIPGDHTKGSKFVILIPEKF